MTHARVAVGAALAASLLAGCGSDDRADEDAFCTELRQSIDQNVTVFDAQDPADPEDAVATLNELAELAPDEIEAEVVVLRDAFRELAAAIDEIDLDDPAAAERVAAVEVDEARIAQAQLAMAAYGRDPCRIPLLNGPDSATTSVPTTAPPPTNPPTSAVPTTAVTTTTAVPPEATTSVAG